jgi:uncharacterized protein YcnI
MAGARPPEATISHMDAARRRSRVACRAVVLVVASAVALLLAAVAGAHVTIAPPFVQDGVVTTIAFQLPNERPPHATTRLTVTAPPGVEIRSARAPAGWQATAQGGTATWTGGRVEGRRTVDFPITVYARVRAGTYGFLAAQRYDDGATVKWKPELSVLPASGSAAPKQHPWGAIAAAVVGVVVILGSVVGLRYLRRSPLQER